MVWYVDTSAFLKLVASEPESTALRGWLAELLQTEALRAGSRLGIAGDVVTDALSTFSLVMPTHSTFLVAGLMDLPALRSLDALHLATALELGGDLDGVVTYDARMAQAAQAASVAVASPA